MSLKIRLSRAGAKKRPYYHIVLAESRSPRDGRFIEKLGSYDPMLPFDHTDRIRLQGERILYWLGTGALPTERVARFLGDAGLIDKPKFQEREQPVQAAPKKKAQERAKAEAAG